MRTARLALLAAALTLAATVAGAQNASQIARARAGASCPRCNLFQADFQGLTLKGKELHKAAARARPTFSSGDPEPQPLLRGRGPARRERLERDPVLRRGFCRAPT